MWNKFVLINILTSIININCSLDIQTKQGTIRGKIWTSQKGREFLGFTGIPYARPPIGKLRFQAPIPAEPWNDTLDATRSHQPCSQQDYFATNFSILGNEDCLYLNVYKPIRGKNLPVMFYIHGGSYSIGSGADNWLGPEILLDKDVVLVVINYRLGVLGFLSLEDDIVPGNNGLKDQAMALRWVRENIGYFGGNETNISVFGNSAGGVSAHFFMMSPLTKDLVAKVIIQSGSATTAFSSGIKGAAKAAGHALGQRCNCSTNSTGELIDCLRDVDVVDLVKNEQLGGADRNRVYSRFVPVVEVKHPDAFITEDPVEIVMSKKFANIPIMIGITEQEAAYRAAEMNTQPGLFQKLNDDFASVVSNGFLITENAVSITKGLRQFYFGNSTIDNSTIVQIANMFSDGWFLNTMDIALYLFLQNKFPKQPVYVYLFGYRGSISYTDLYGDASADYGVCHTDELLYLLPRKQNFPNYNPTTEDIKMANILTQLWVDFAATGTPTPVLKTWKPLKNEQVQFLHIQGANDLKMEEGLFSTRRNFWRDNVYQSLWNRIRKS